MLFHKNDYWLTLEKDKEKVAKIVKRVEKEKDPEKLFKIAMEAPNWQVCRAAIKKVHSYDQLMRINSARKYKYTEEVAESLPDDSLRIRFLGEATFEEEYTAACVIKTIKDKDMLYEAICSGMQFNSEKAAQAVIGKTKDLSLLKKISSEGKGTVQELAKKKVEDYYTLETIAGDENISIEKRFDAAHKIEEVYDDLGPKKELQKLGTPGPWLHLLYCTVNDPWAQLEYICLRCGKIGGRIDDSESTERYGCNFDNEVCHGV